MLTQGADPSRATIEAAEPPSSGSQQAVEAGQIAGFTDEFEAAFTDQDSLAACMAWSGDIVQLQQTRPDLGVEFVIPDRGRHPVVRQHGHPQRRGQRRRPPPSG